MSEIIDQLLVDVGEDKTDNLSTTSLKFKRDLWDYFSGRDFDVQTCIEFGTHKGQTTRILSHLFKQVFTINISEQHFVTAKELNKDRDNIYYIPFDLYAYHPTYKPCEDVIDVFFIDAGHDQEQVYSDVSRALHMNLGKVVYFIFDDYGMKPGVTEVVDTFISEGYFHDLSYIGHEPGYNFGGYPPRILYNTEGIICKLDQDKLTYG